MRSSDVLLSVTPLSFDIAGLELYLPLVVGGRVVVAGRTVATDPAALQAVLSASGATVLQANSSNMGACCRDRGWQPDDGLTVLVRRKRRVSAGRSVVFLSQGYGPWHGNLYGPTETTIWSTASQLTRGKPISIGGPIFNTRLYILDDLLDPVPLGASGELYIGGVGCCAGICRATRSDGGAVCAKPVWGE